MNRRTEIITFRVTEDERQKLSLTAKAAGQRGISALLRLLVSQATEQMSARPLASKREKAA